MGTVAENAYDDRLTALVGQTPIFTLVNRLNTQNQDVKNHVKGHIGIDWIQMGKATGKYLALQHPKNSGRVTVALLPGPQYRGSSEPMIQGFLTAIENSDVEVIAIQYADNNKELQRNLIQALLTKTPNINYLVGSAVAANVAISELRNHHHEHDIRILSTYLSHGVYRGLTRHKILFSPTDSMVEQGRMAITQAVRYLRHQTWQVWQQPPLETFTPNSITYKKIKSSLSPSEFRPNFTIIPISLERKPH